MRLSVLFGLVVCFSGKFVKASSLSEDEVSYITETCCEAGAKFAVTASAVRQCNDAEPPDDVEPEDSVICLAGLRSCCEKHFKLKDECTEGMTYSPAKRCSVPKTDTGKTCCEECSFGRLTGESQGKEGCGDPADDYVSPATALRRNAYHKCCIEAAEKPTTTQPPPTTSTTTQPPATTPPPPRERCQPNSCDHHCHDDDGHIRCSCKEGYRLQLDKKACKDINECAEAVDDLCTTEGTVCHNTPGSFKCVPFKKRDVSLSCPPGFKRNVKNQVCDDINECQSPRPPCPKYLCENTIGGYKCAGKPGKPYEEAGPGKVTEPQGAAPPEKNDICPPGFRSGPTDECLDIDECEEHADDCQRLSQYCINTHGSFFCQDHVSKRCAPGFVVNKSTGVCEDINECAESSSELCKRNEVCVNMPGAYTCKSKISTLPQLGTSVKNCQEGTRPRPGGAGCEDIDECREGTHLCDQFQNCVNTFGAHECRCKGGFELDSKGSGSCVDIDECALRLDNCRAGTYCLNVVGTFTCTRRPPAPAPAPAPTTSTGKPAAEYEYEYYDDDEDNSTTTTNDTAPQPEQPPLSQPSPSKPPVPAVPSFPDTQQPTRPPYIPRATTTKRPYTNPPRTYPTRPERPTSSYSRPNASKPDIPGMPGRHEYRPSSRPDAPQNPRGANDITEPGRKPVNEPPVIPRRAYVTTSSTPETPAVAERPEATVNPRRPPQRRPEVTEVTVPSPTNPVTIEKETDRNGSYDIDTSDIPKDTWTNVIGKDTPETNFNPDEMHCLHGFQKNAQGGCDDIDECENNSHICTAVEVCVNRDGGYICNCKPGYKKNPSGFCVPDSPPVAQTTTTTAAPIPPPPPTLPPRPDSIPDFERPVRPRCKPGQSYDYSRGECTAPPSPPPPPPLPPRPESGPGPADRPDRPRVSSAHCELGYKYDTARGTCVDVNECATNRASCSPDEDCVNVEGGYRCVCGRPCRRPPSREPKPAYAVPPRQMPADSNVITVGAQYGQRGPRYLRPSSSRLPDSGAIVNSCPWGYKLTGEKMCLDIDECAKNISECGPQQRCENFYGGHSCQCPAGHKLLGTDRCTDIDECLFGQPCPFHSKCVNTEGSYHCSCGEGFRNAPNNDKACVDIDECTETPGACEQGCINAWGSYRCYCSRGYRLTNDSRTCEDVDECAEFAAARSRGRLCGGECNNVPGSYRCTCPAGYRLADDGRSCIDIDECESGAATCARAGDGEVCQNTRGGYHCHRIDCPQGYRLEAKHRCSRIQRSCPVGDWGCLHQPSSYTYNFISFVSNMQHDGSVDLFTMRGPAWVQSVVTFEMRLVSVEAAPGVVPVDIGCFDMRPMNNICVISLRCSPQGPQVAELELSMSLFQRQQFAGSAVARLVVIVSQYEF